MKILIHSDNHSDKVPFFVDYLRNTMPDVMQDVVIIDISRAYQTWAASQNDITYVYFEEEINYGSIFNQVIRELKLNEDILITDAYHLPLIGSIENLYDALQCEKNAFAVGPVSNSFTGLQEIHWENAETALIWSEGVKDLEADEVLNLRSGVILFSKDVLHTHPFCEDAIDIENMILEKCIREFLNHRRMYVCKTSGFWDIRAGAYKESLNLMKAGVLTLLNEKFDLHYLNVSGNIWLSKLIEETIKHDTAINILEIGCDCGGTLFRLKKTYRNASIYGTDISEGSLKFASEFVVTALNNIEDHNLNFGVKFDLIIFGDVLEHLRDPLGAIEYCKTLLNPGGRIAASIPNLMNISVIKLLLNGDFPYEDAGLLDRTHIHMFTYNEIIKMFVNYAGMRIEKLTMNGSLNKEDNLLVDTLLKLGKAEKFMYQAFQYQVIAVLDA